MDAKKFHMPTVVPGPIIYGVYTVFTFHSLSDVQDDMTLDIIINV